MPENAQPPKQSPQTNKSKLLVAISIAIAVVAGVAIAFTLLAAPKSVNTNAAKTVEVKLVQNKPAEETAPPTVETPRYVLKFQALKGVLVATPLTYPNEQGVVFLSIRTKNATNEIWTFKDGNLVGKYKLKGAIVPVFDVRKGEYALYHGKLLVGINGTLYAIYGDEAEKVAKYNLIPNSKVGIFVKKGEIYSWIVKTTTKNNNTIVYCALYDLLKNKELANYTFNLGTNVSAANPLPDLLDGQGCLVLWVETASPIMHYEYKGTNGQTKGQVDLIKMRVATFAPLFLETAPYSSKPYFILITLGERGSFKALFHDVLDNKTITFTLPGLYNFVSVGDYLGNGYVGDALFLVLTREGVKLEILNVNGKYQEVNIGKLNKELAVFNGIEFSPVNKRVFGLGNYTNNYVDIVSNAGTLKFKVENVPQNISSLFIVGSLDGTKLCYTAIVNPTVGGLRGAQKMVKGEVYLASGCSG